MSRLVGWLLAMLLLLPGVGTVAVGGTTTMDYAWLLFLKVNEPPQVDAGLDKEITWATDSVDLDATATDDPRDSLTYVWTMFAGPGDVSFSSPGTEDTTATFSVTPGIYILQLSVSDGDLTTTSTVTIEFNNSAPVVDSGPDISIIHPDNSVNLNATASDHPNDTLTYFWSKLSGPGTVTFANPSAEDTRASFWTLGTYELQLRASDGELATTDTVMVEYLPEPITGPKVDVIVAVGNSITVGFGDSDCVPGDAKACSGYTPKLKTLLDNARGYSHTIWEEGTGGKPSAYGRLVIQSIIDAHPAADQYLAMYGTNDANRLLPVPSGLGLSATHPDYPGTYKDNMGVIINKVKLAGAQPALAKVPYVIGTTNEGTTKTQMNTRISLYNQVVDELVRERSLSISPPDFFSWFMTHQTQIHAWYIWDTTIRDNVHPTHDGYWSMANIWRDKLLQ